MAIRTDAVTVIYLDLYFMTNFVTDFFLSVLVCTAMNWKCGLWRRLAAAFAGSLLACLFLTAQAWVLKPGQETALRWVSAVCGAWVMSFLLGRRGAGLREKVKGALFLVLGAAGFAGVVDLFELEGIYTEKDSGHPLPTAALYLGILVYCWLVSALIHRLRVQQRLEAGIVPVELVVRGRRWRLRALVDTGNNLYDPFRARPVHIVEAGAVPELADMTDGLWFYVPYQSLGQTGKVIPVTIAERMYIYLKDETICLEQQCVGVADQTLNSHGSYHMLLHPDYRTEHQRGGSRKSKKEGNRKETAAYGDQSECARQDSA